MRESRGSRGGGERSQCIKLKCKSLQVRSSNRYIRHIGFSTPAPPALFGASTLRELSTKQGHKAELPHLPVGDTERGFCTDQQ